MTALIIAYVVLSYAVLGWVVHRNFDGVFRLAGWFVWLFSPVALPWFAFHWLRGVLARGL